MAKAKNDDTDPKKSAGKVDKAAAKDGDKKADDKKDDKAAAKADDKKADDKKVDDKKADDNKSAAAKEDNKADEPEESPVPPRPAPPVTPKPGDSEDVVLLPPRAIDTSVSPSTPAPAPGPAPAGDARSLRRGDDFCVIYRHRSYLIRREGKVGTAGEWTVTEYPNMAAAAHAYAQECSDLTGDGFDDVR